MYAEALPVGPGEVGEVDAESVAMDSDIDIANMHDEDFKDESDVLEMADGDGREPAVLSGLVLCKGADTALVPHRSVGNGEGISDNDKGAAGSAAGSASDIVPAHAGDEAAMVAAIKTAETIQKAGIVCKDVAEVAAQAAFTKNMSKNKLFELGLLMCEVCLSLPAVDPKHPWCLDHKTAVERAEKSSRKLDKVVPGSKEAFAAVRRDKDKSAFRVFMIDFINRTAKWDAETESFIKIDYNWAQLVRIKSHQTAYLVALMWL